MTFSSQHFHDYHRGARSKSSAFALINEANLVKCYKASMTSRAMNMRSLGCVLRGRENTSMKQKRGRRQVSITGCTWRKNITFQHDKSILFCLNQNKATSRLPLHCIHNTLCWILGVWSEYYLRTRSDAWLDLGPSQLWCFSLALASFSAAAMGHPDRLQRESGWWRTRFDRWKCYNERTRREASGSLERLSERQPGWKQLEHICLSDSRLRRLP